MIGPEIKNILVKYLSNEATVEDLDVLCHWVLREDNERIFEDFVKIHYQTITAMNKPDVDKIKKNLFREIDKDAKKHKIDPYVSRAKSVLKYAAVGLLFLAIGHLYQQEYFSTEQKETLVPNEELITIELDNGKVETIDVTGNKKVRSADGKVIGTQKQSQLVYSGAENVNELVFNTLKVPYGKRFDVVLSDGTHVFLNSGSSLRYPIKFLTGSERTVFLMGEAYFDVAKDEDHPFIVNTDNIDIRVLGTQFNVSYYSEDPSINTVLVEGSVELKEDNGQGGETAASTLLKPGFMAEWNKTNREMSVENVDTRIYTAWLQGKLIFRNTTFRKIRQALERKYNITIINKNPNLDDQLFDATFDIETIEQVLESFNKSYAIDYKITDNKVIIN